ncbi:hypothetical protein [Nonomuraea sp. NPDC005650]|uniref:hypothetical protein n=1 Tax=Nonomuraea sp. NPDC005650 TaxID=3157045 RepID=UPI0033B7402E
MIPNTDPSAWRIVMDASEATLSSGHETRDFDGSFYLSPDESLAGFTLRLSLPGAPELLWESASLEGGTEVRGSSLLHLGRRTARADVSGFCARVPVGLTGSSYLKIVLTATFSPLRLRWPGWRVRPVTLRLFSEIRPTVLRSR